MKFIITLIFAFLIFQGFALAQNNVQRDLYNNYITKNKNYTAQLHLKNDRIYKLSFPDCDEDIEKKRYQPMMLINPQFIIPNKDEDTKLSNDDDDDSNTANNLAPNHGQWVERTLAMACGSSAQINILTTAYNYNETPTHYPMLNGQTKIDLIFQNIAEEKAKEAVKSQSNCYSDVFIVDTKFLGYRQSANNKLTIENNFQGWLEQWKVRACNQIQTVNIAVLPDPNTKHRFLAKIEAK